MGVPGLPLVLRDVLPAQRILPAWLLTGMEDYMLLSRMDLNQVTQQLLLTSIAIRVILLSVLLLTGTIQYARAQQLILLPMGPASMPGAAVTVPRIVHQYLPIQMQ